MTQFCEPQTWGMFKRDLVARKVREYPLASTHAISELVRHGQCVPFDLILDAVSALMADSAARPLATELRKWTRKAAAASPSLGGTQGQIRGTFCESIQTPKRAFDPRSFRWKRSGKAWVLVGCPKGKWASRKKTCKVGLKAYTLLVPAPKKGRCKRATKRITK